MWVGSKRNWHHKYTSLSKYLIEKILQSVDYGELISNQHRTTNGFTLVAEIVEVCRQTLLRTKSSRRLQSLLEEAKENKLRSSIKNDYIISKYFPDIATYYDKLNPQDIKQSSDNLIKRIKLDSTIHLERLNLYYYHYIKQEISDLDLQSNKFDRISEDIDSLLDCLIPYLLFKGLSADSIGALVSNVQIQPSTLIKNFLATISDPVKNFEFLILDTASHSNHNGFEEYLTANNFSFELITDAGQYKFSQKSHLDKTEGYLIKHKTSDPNTFLRTLYEKSFKHYIGREERVSLPFYSGYFKTSFWRFADKENAKFSSVFANKDPLNVASRNSTLRETLDSFSKCGLISYKRDTGLPVIKAIKESVFYYNLALGSKSIENSLMLLWTALETLVPYRYKDNDIDNVQYFVSNSLGFGSIGRELSSFVRRAIETNNLNKGHLNKHIASLPTCTCKTENLIRWIDWLSQKFETDSDPFNDMAQCSSILSKSFVRLNDFNIADGEKERKVKIWSEMIEKSETSIHYQLDRIYLHRNQIVHAGKFVNEYTNLWSHLEWYTGKLLSYAYLKCFSLDCFNDLDKIQIYAELEADSTHIKNLLLNNKEKGISEISKEFPVIFKHAWQFI